MPNHVANILTFEGDDKRVSEILHFIKYDNEPYGSFDFEKIIPMPDYIYRDNVGPEEFEKYGKNNWYDWSIENWGTKWNSYDSYEISDEEKEIFFYTAWSAPHPVIEKLVSMFPDVEVIHKWADEDLGYNCGRRVYQEGSIVEEYFPEGDEALRFACIVQGIEPESLEYM